MATLVGPLCLAVLAALLADDNDSAGYVLTLAAAGFALGVALRALLGAVLGAVNVGVQAQGDDPHPISAAIDRGLLLLVPFTVMAAIARLGLGWDAATVFASTAMMTAGGTAGAEVGRIGGRRVPSTVAPIAVAMAATLLWALAAAQAPDLLPGAG